MCGTASSIAALVVGVLVWGLIAYVVIRYRRRSSDLPRQVRENIPIEIAYTVVPLLIIVALFAVTFTSVRAIDDVDDDVDLVVEVVGFQWQWRFNYPDAGVEVVGTEARSPSSSCRPAPPCSSTSRRSTSCTRSGSPASASSGTCSPARCRRSRSTSPVSPATTPNSGVCAEFCGLDHTSMRFDVRIVSRRRVRPVVAGAIVMTAELRLVDVDEIVRRELPDGAPVCRGRSSAG